MPDERRTKAAALPLTPGVYIMRDREGKVIYVGKAKKLKNRVSQYFARTDHPRKVANMVRNAADFEVILTDTELEALVLENNLIKKYKPKYNILLKDDKGYPYIRLEENIPYPTFSVVPSVSNDKASYYGPFGSRSITKDILETISMIQDENLDIRTVTMGISLRSGYSTSSEGRSRKNGAAFAGKRPAPSRNHRR